MLEIFNIQCLPKCLELEDLLNKQQRMDLKIEISLQYSRCSTFLDIFQHFSPIHCKLLKTRVDVIISADRINFFLYYSPD